MKRMTILLMGGALALGACSTTPAPVAAVDLNNPLMAPGYLSMAASSDMFEIQSSQLAQQMSSSAGVRNMAAMLIADHTQSTQMLMASAAAARLPAMTPVLLPQHQALLDQLRATGPGYAFDQAWQQIQIQAHQQALTLHQNYATSGDVPQLRATAGQIVPVVQRHLQMAQSLQLMAPPPPPPAPMAPPPPRRAGERG